MQTPRDAANEADGASAASELFVREFDIDLGELVDLYRDEHWKDAPMHGGSAWAAIAQAVIDLRDALEHGDAGRAAELLSSIPAMNHNTGQVGTKLGELDAAILA